MGDLNAFDTYGRTFIRALLRDEPKPETIVDLRSIMARERASYTLEQIAAEVDVALPALPAITMPTGPERRLRAKRRH